MPVRAAIDLSNRRWVKWAALFVLSVMLAIFLIQAYHKAYRDVGYDFTSYLLSARAVLHGENPYATGTPFMYIYPMFLAFSLIPLSLLPYWLSNLLWYLIGVTSLLWSIVLFVKLSANVLKTNWGSHLYAPLVVVLLFMIPVIQNNLLNGQVNFVVLLFCALFLKYDFEGKALPASIFLALAISIKLVPLIFFLFLILRRKYKTILLTTGLTAVFCLLPVITLGRDLFNLYGVYVHHFIAGEFAGGRHGHSMYFTLYGFLLHIIPSLETVAGLKIVSAVIVVLSVAAIDVLSIRRNSAESGRWTCHLYLMSILLVLPFSETHHLAFLIPAFALLSLALLYDENMAGSTYGVLLLAFLACFYAGRIIAGPFSFMAIVLLFVIVTRLSLLKSSAISVSAESGMTIP